MRPNSLSNMQIVRTRKSMASFGAAALLAMTAATAQVVTNPGAAGDKTLPGAGGIDGTGNFQSEVLACNTGRTQEDRDTCLREARNARADKQRGDLNKDNSTDYTANAAARCNALQGDDRAACQARMLGYGQVSGTVAGGGILREVETVVVPAGESQVTVQPKTNDPVVLVPAAPDTGMGAPAAPATLPAPMTAPMTAPMAPPVTR